MTLKILTAAAMFALVAPAQAQIRVHSPRNTISVHSVDQTSHRHRLSIKNVQNFGSLVIRWKIENPVNVQQRAGTILLKVGESTTLDILSVDPNEPRRGTLLFEWEQTH